MFEIAFIGSLSSKNTMEKADEKLRKLFKNDDLCIHIPVHKPDISFNSIVEVYFMLIKCSDLVIAFPKEDGCFGKGTIYEMEYARSIGKKVLIWNQEGEEKYV